MLNTRLQGRTDDALAAYLHSLCPLQPARLHPRGSSTHWQGDASKGNPRPPRLPSGPAPVPGLSPHHTTCLSPLGRSLPSSISPLRKTGNREWKHLLSYIGAHHSKGSSKHSACHVPTSRQPSSVLRTVPYGITPNRKLHILLHLFASFGVHAGNQSSPHTPYCVTGLIHVHPGTHLQPCKKRHRRHTGMQPHACGSPAQSHQSPNSLIHNPTIHSSIQTPQDSTTRLRGPNTYKLLHAPTTWRSRHACARPPAAPARHRTSLLCPPLPYPP